MKAILITFDQSYTERIIDMLTTNNCRGFSMVEQLQGRGSKTGEPHYATHAWPSIASAILTVVDDRRVDIVLDELHQMDVATPKLGLRAFVLPVERTI